MAQIIDKHSYRTDVYEVAENWPIGYVVWNIGRSNFNYPGYIPLCKNGDPAQVDLRNLVALKIDDEQLCLAILKEAGLHRVDEERFNEIRKTFSK